MALHQQIISSIKWTAFGKAASQAISWVVTLYVIRILAPGDFGLMAMTSVVIAFCPPLINFGWAQRWFSPNASTTNTLALSMVPCCCWAWS